MSANKLFSLADEERGIWKTKEKTLASVWQTKFTKHEEKSIFFPSQKENNARGGRGILIMRVYLKDYNSEAKLVKFGNL